MLCDGAGSGRCRFASCILPVVGGTVVEGDEPEGTAVGVEVDLAKTASVAGQGWQ